MTEKTLLRDRNNKYTMICQLIGQHHTGTYFVDGQPVISSSIVGDPPTRCRGRCGVGCYQFMQWRKNQYTQECFDHDLCHDDTGSIMGPCADSFWKAYHSYMYAPDCFPSPRQ